MKPLLLPTVEQRRDCDCGVAALATLAGIPYEDAYVASVGYLKGGLTLGEIIKIGAELGLVLKRKQRFDPEEDVGILSVAVEREGYKRLQGHVVVLAEGKVIDPADGRFYFSLEDFVALEKAKVGILLKLDVG